MMDTLLAARSILDSKAINDAFGEGFKGVRDRTGLGVHHALWMLEGIALGYVQYEKSHRWLGYAQAILTGEKLFSLDQMKNVNKGS